jgi:hypothetical protein
MLLFFAWPSVGRLARVGLTLYMLAMATTLVYGGEHYVSDELLGWAYAALAVFGVRWWFARREAAENPTGTADSPRP